MNLFWALDRMRNALDEASDFVEGAWTEAQRIVDEKPDDALHALRKMLANPEPENAR